VAAEAKLSGQFLQVMEELKTFLQLRLRTRHVYLQRVETKIMKIIIIIIIFCMKSFNLNWVR